MMFSVCKKVPFHLLTCVLGAGWGTAILETQLRFFWALVGCGVKALL